MTPHYFLWTANAAGPEPTYAQPYPGYSGNQLTSLCPSQTQVFCRVLQFLDNGLFFVYWVIFAHCQPFSTDAVLVPNLELIPHISTKKLRQDWCLCQKAERSLEPQNCWSQSGYGRGYHQKFTVYPLTGTQSSSIMYAVCGRYTQAIFNCKM